ncbi:polyprenyl synthetase family protein [Streptomyces albidochromogenes]|uniref:Polyprenyl synthetase family protein n=1 Tax=Streptomyces albidochromogenes TaxID=329524 RepID=A0ABW6FKM1_9ACTN
MTGQIRSRLAGYEHRFGAMFAEYFRGLHATLDAPAFSRFAPECLELVRDLSLRGGKRMRVALLHEAARLVTTEPLEALDDAALSVELLQTHGLIHDDIIDDSPTRRGGPSTYYAYRERFPDHQQAALGLAVLAGDLAFALCLRVLLDSTAPPAVRQAMVEIQVRAASATFMGQISDIERDFTPLPADDVLHDVAEYKSARYSALATMQLGLLAAGEDPARFEKELRRYARLVGIAEQMCDDYEDLFGDAKAMGKPTGGDIREGRRNYVVSALLTAASASERATVERALGDAAGSEETVAAIRDIAVRRGVQQKLRTDVQRYARLASAEAATWRPRWRDEAVTFFEVMPVWSAQRIMG